MAEHSVWVVCPGDCVADCGRLCSVNPYLGADPCSSCGHPIGFEVPLLFQGIRGQVHASCLAAILCALFSSVPDRGVSGSPNPSLQEPLRSGSSSGGRAAACPPARRSAATGALVGGAA